MAKVKIRWSLNSFNDLEKIAEYISQDSPYYAPIFVKKIIGSVDRLSEFPNSGRVVPEFNNPQTREIIFHNYRIIYRLREDYIEISDVLHSARLLE